MNKKLWAVLAVVILAAGIFFVVRAVKKPEYAKTVSVSRDKTGKSLDLIRQGQEFAARDDVRGIKRIMANLDSTGAKELWENLKALPPMKWDNAESWALAMAPGYIRITVPGDNGQKYLFRIMDKADELKLYSCRPLP